jgi:hypothetical protein
MTPQGIMTWKFSDFIPIRDELMNGLPGWCPPNPIATASLKERNWGEELVVRVRLGSADCAITVPDRIKHHRWSVEIFLHTINPIEADATVSPFLSYLEFAKRVAQIQGEPLEWLNQTATNNATLDIWGTDWDYVGAKRRIKEAFYKSMFFLTNRQILVGMSRITLPTSK